MTLNKFFFFLVEAPVALTRGIVRAVGVVHHNWIEDCWPKPREIDQARPRVNALTLDKRKSKRASDVDDVKHLRRK